MSFMFNPHPYEDPSAVNRPQLPPAVAESLVVGGRQIAQRIIEEARGKTYVLCLDGYPSAQFEPLVNHLSAAAHGVVVFAAFDVAEVYKPADMLEKTLTPNLPQNRAEDPVLLYGQLHHGGYATIFDEPSVAALVEKVELARKSSKPTFIVVYGLGAAAAPFRHLYDAIAWLDVTPKRTVLRAKNGEYRNIGDAAARPFKALMRRAYYIDFECAGTLRGELLRAGAINYYIASDDPTRPLMMTGATLNTLLAAMARQPFRCKPVYLEGVWGGQYIKRLRKIPDTMRNIAWIFDLIPLEVSIVIAVGKELVEIPYFTFVQQAGDAIMGPASVKRFGYFFPIRFNYDDTWHSNGNMSIQVHPGEEYAKKNFAEHGRQDESYYVVATGHGAKTYIGFREDADTDAFVRAVKESETKHTPVDHDAFVSAVPSTPGTQLILPAGTIHASGRNQLILEIGSLTVGSYTFKMYDYLRADLDGIPRPIHALHGERVLATERRTKWVSENLVQSPREVRRGPGFAEYIVGEHNLVYFSLRRLEFERAIEDDTQGRFHVLTLVDGESVVVESLDDPSRAYTLQYLDVVVVPAVMGRYRIRNLGNQPVVIHKTLLKDGFEHA